jgi:diguanylate cyclase (GGDEF)-like protein
MIRDDAGQPVHALAQVLDISERRSYEERLKHLADHDPLTGLPNRRALEGSLEDHLARCRRYGAAGGLLLLDLDGFKMVNDTLGHAAGDELLVGCADALRRRLRETDVIARLGGDEFAVLIPVEDRDEAERVAQALIDTVREYAAGGMASERGRVTASIGIALFEDAPLTAREMLIRADFAMYAAKSAGKDRYALYSQDAGRRGAHNFAQ